MKYQSYFDKILTHVYALTDTLGVKATAVTEVMQSIEELQTQLAEDTKPGTPDDIIVTAQAAFAELAEAGKISDKKADFINGQLRVLAMHANAEDLEEEPPRAHHILNAGIGHMENRAITYDAPGGERSMSATVIAFNAIARKTLTEEQGWLFMELLKCARAEQGEFKLDNYEDGGAYAALKGEAGYRERVQSISLVTPQ
jgi:hypothetical protein